MPRWTKTLRERILEKVKLKPNGCWQWSGANDGRYGMMTVDYKLVKAHRASYEVFKGKIPSGKEIDHLCGNKMCVNPEHLEAVAHAINIRRARGTAPDVDGNVVCPRCSTTYKPADTSQGTCQVCRLINQRKYDQAHRDQNRARYAARAKGKRAVAQSSRN